VVAVALVALGATIPTTQTLAASRQAGLVRETAIGSLALPGVGNAVLLALNSIQIDRDVEILSGDLVVNDASPGPVLGETELSLDRGVTTAAGYSVRADGVDVDQDAVVGGDVVFNQLSNGGTIAGAQVSPLALPVFTELPPLAEPSDRPSEGDVTVANGATVVLAEGSYGALTIGTGGVLQLTGGDYTFSSVSAGSGGALVFGAASRVVVRGRVALGSGAVVGPADGSGASASNVVFHVHGVNGLDGALGSTPPAVEVGKQSSIEANLYAPFGQAVFDRGLDLVGAVIARDIHVGRGDDTVGSGGALALDSAFGNRAPTADPQTVFTAGAAPVDVTLTGSDPEGEDLSFSIVSGPTQGSLSSITPIVPPPVIDPETLETIQPRVTSAVVTYPRATAGDAEDSFSFAVSDPAGASGMAIVTINPPGSETPPPPPPDTVVAADGADQTFEDRPLTVTLTGGAPDAVALSFSIVAGSGPANGSLGPLVPGSESPQRSAAVVYTPATGFLGSDAFDFEACGVIASVTVCDTATMTIEVVEEPVEPQDLAQDQQVTTGSGQAVQISLAGGDAVLEQAAALTPRRVVVRPRAAFIDGAEIAGNVADADDNGFGDNHNALPGSVPGLMSAGVDLSGGAGSNGTVRMHVEWDISTFGGLAGVLESADVILSTHRGTIDSLDTFFWWVGEDGDGLLTDSDFEAAAEPIPGAVMPVPPTTEMPIGADGSFSFSVLAELEAAIDQGLDYFTIQGRVDESLTGPARGLEVRTSALGNLSSFLEPQLSLATPGLTPPIEYTITSLPAHGTLKDGFGTSITAVPYTLPDARVSYVSSGAFVGTDSFAFQVSDGFTVDLAVINLDVILGSCAQNVLFCPDGR
jgi:hypothetical protein